MFGKYAPLADARGRVTRVNETLHGPVHSQPARAMAMLAHGQTPTQIAVVRHLMGI